MAGIVFYPNDYIQQNYLPDTCVTAQFPEGCNVPYIPVLIAMQYNWDVSPKSLLVCDKGIPFENSKAHSIIQNPLCGVVCANTTFVDNDTNEHKDGKKWTILFKNMECSMFKPTIHKPISDACNVYSEVTYEVMLSFDDGYVCPIVRKVKTEGPFAMSFMDIIDDFMDNLQYEARDAYEFLFSECPNARFVKGEGEGEEDCWLLTVTSTETGASIELEFPVDDKVMFHELKRAISTFRIIELKSEITKNRS